MCAYIYIYIERDLVCIYADGGAAGVLEAVPGGLQQPPRARGPRQGPILYYMTLCYVIV